VYYVEVCVETELRMVPKKKTVWVVIEPDESKYNGYKVSPYTYPCAQIDFPSYPIEIED